MKPGSFDPQTAREAVGDDRARRIEDKARQDADADRYEPPPLTDGGSYWCRCQEEFARSVYTEQFRKRRERNARKAAKEQS